MRSAIAPSHSSKLLGTTQRRKTSWKAPSVNTVLSKKTQEASLAIVEGKRVSHDPMWKLQEGSGAVEEKQGDAIEEHTNEEGKTYYYDRLSQQTAWSKDEVVCCFSLLISVNEPSPTCTSIISLSTFVYTPPSCSRLRIVRRHLHRRRAGSRQV